MPVVGIVAEYNPLHNGHAYHIGQARVQTGAEGVICVMSGCYTQRGEPALVNKYTRAEMAIWAGADLVFELPFAFAARSASHFARGAVQLLARTGVVTHLSFGSEQGSVEPLAAIASLLAKEPTEFQVLLRDFLDTGLSFAEARARALEAYLNTIGQSSPELAQTLSSPNNILGIEYLRTLIAEELPITPHTVRRIGAGYHESGDQHFPSATHIRNSLAQGTAAEDLTGLPDRSLEILCRERSRGVPFTTQASMFDLLRYSLRMTDAKTLSTIYDVAEGLENRVLKAAQTAASMDELLQMLKTRRYSRTRLNRVLLYQMVRFTQEMAQFFDDTGPLYLRLLAFSPRGQKILHKMKTKTTVPIVSKLGKLRRSRYPDDGVRRMLELDVLATDLYALLQGEPTGIDHLLSPIFVPRFEPD